MYGFSSCTEPKNKNAKCRKNATPFQIERLTTQRARLIAFQAAPAAANQCIHQSRHVDRWHAFGRMRDERRMSSCYRERNDRNNHNQNVTHHDYWTLGLGASEPLAWNVFIKQQNAHRQQQAHAAKQCHRSTRLKFGYGRFRKQSQSKCTHTILLCPSDEAYFTASSFSISSSRAWQ